MTSSSAVANRPRDALCLSVVIASIVQNVEQSLLLLVTYATDLSLRAIKCCSVVFGVTLKLLVINISPSFPAINKHRRLLPAKCHNLRDGGPTASYWQHLAGSSVNSTHWSQILAQNRDFCLPHLHSTPSLWGFPSEYCHDIWCRKTRIAWLPDGEKISKISLFVLTECTNVTDGQTEGQTPHGDIGRACIVSRGKKMVWLPDTEKYSSILSRFSVIWC